MLRNIIYRDKNIEIIMVADGGNLMSSVSVHVYAGHSTGIRTIVSVLRCDFSSRLTSALLPCILVSCWTLVREEGSISDENQASVNKAIRKELVERRLGIREVDWTKEIPTEVVMVTTEGQILTGASRSQPVMTNAARSWSALRHLPISVKPISKRRPG